MFGVLLKLTPAFIFALPGIIVLARHPGIADQRSIFVTILNEMLPSGIRGYVLSALVGAIISALIAVMNSISTMAVRDFFLHFRPQTSERTQIILGRAAIVVSAVLGTAAAYWVHRQPEGIYKYLQTISIYLVTPIAPAIIFGIMSKRVTFTGAAASVFTGVALTLMYFVDFIRPLTANYIKAPANAPRFAASWFHGPVLRLPLASPALDGQLHLSRGAVGHAVIVVVLFAVSAFTEKTDADKLAQTTVDWRRRPEPFRGLADWRLQVLLLLAATARSSGGSGKLET